MPTRSRMALTWATSPAVSHLLGACLMINRFQRVPVGHPEVRSWSYPACLSETLGLARPTSLMTMCHSTLIVKVQQLSFATPRFLRKDGVAGRNWDI
jgi:hypothetical protein